MNESQKNKELTQNDGAQADMAISVSDVSKRFKLYTQPKDRLKELLTFGKKRAGHNFWALRDITFDVPRGTSVGIVGRNGSGKSTLLKLICGTMYPTSGDIKVKGRISSLLELGIGFNAELTGKENVFIQGAILGYSKSEMEERAKLIEEFADIGEFINQPVKHYSSGMMVRLAFAAAINIDPDILVIDEAISVGDLKFQRKCFSRIEELRRQNKTILLVSHSIDTINMYCDEALLLDGGKILFKGNPNLVLNYYSKLLFSDDNKKPNEVISEIVEDNNVRPELPLDQGGNPGKDEQVISELTQTGIKPDINTAETREQMKIIALKNFNILVGSPHQGETRHGDGKAEIIDFGMLDNNYQPSSIVKTGNECIFVNRVLLYDDLEDIQLQMAIKDVLGISFFWTNTFVQNIYVGHQKRGTILEAYFHIMMWLAPGHYFLNVVALNSDKTICYDRRMDAFEFDVCGGEGQFGPGSKVNLESKIDLKIIEP